MEGAPHGASACSRTLKARVVGRQVLGFVERRRVDGRSTLGAANHLETNGSATVVQRENGLGREGRDGVGGRGRRMRIGHGVSIGRRASEPKRNPKKRVVPRSGTRAQTASSYAFGSKRARGFSLPSAHFRANALRGANALRRLGCADVIGFGRTARQTVHF